MCGMAGNSRSLVTTRGRSRSSPKAKQLITRENSVETFASHTTEPAGAPISAAISSACARRSSSHCSHASSRHRSIVRQYSSSAAFAPRGAAPAELLFRYTHVSRRGNSARAAPCPAGGIASSPHALADRLGGGVRAALLPRDESTLARPALGHLDAHVPQLGKQRLR